MQFDFFEAFLLVCRWPSFCLTSHDLCVLIRTLFMLEWPPNDFTLAWLSHRRTCLQRKLHSRVLGVTFQHVNLVGRDASGCNIYILCFSGQFAENETNEVNFREIPSHVLSKVCMYFTYKVRYTNSSTEIPEFPIAPEIALELLMAANFLDC